MHAISSYCGNRPTHTHTNRRVRLQYTAPLASAQCKYSANSNWHQRADKRHDSPPQGNQELLVVKYKVGRSPGEVGASPWNVIFFPSVLWKLVWQQEGHPACKKFVLICCWWRFDWSSNLAPIVTITSIILCINKHRLTQVHLENDR